jgi:hypothetical protein
MRKMKLVFAVLLAVSAIGLGIIGYGCMSTVQETVSTTTVSTTTTTIYARSWGTATRISEGAGTTDIFPDVVMDDSGNAIVVWGQVDGTGVDSIYANRYVAGSGWGTPDVIESGSGIAQSPHIAMDSSGSAIAVWRQEDGTGVDSIYANRYVAGSGWGTAGLIESGSGTAEGSSIAMDSGGNAIAVWEQDDGTGINSIYANRYAAGSGWGAATAIESDDLNAGGPIIAVNGSGNAVAVWEEYAGENDETRNNYSIHANGYAAGSGWGAAANIGIGTVTGEVNNCQVAIDESGNAIAVWSQSDGTVFNIYSNTYDPGTGWGTAETLENEAGNAYAPEIAIDGMGNAIAVWQQSDGTRYNIWAKQYFYGAWETGKTNIQSNPRDSYGPQIAVNVSGEAVVVWITIPSMILWSSRFTSGSWEASQEIDSGETFNGRQQVAINNNGDAVAVWQHGIAIGQLQIWANMYR